MPTSNTTPPRLGKNATTPPYAANYGYGYNAHATGGAQFSLRKLLHLFLERWWIGLIAAALATTIFILVQPKRTPVFQTEVKLLFAPQKDQVIGIKEVVDTTTSTNLQLNLHVEQMYSNSFFEFFLASFTQKEIEQIQAPYHDPENPTAPPPSLAAIIRSHLTVVPDKATTIVRVIVENRDPDCAALIANRFARKYIDFTIDKAVSGTNSAIVFLKNQSDEKRAELETVERAMQDYRAKHNMAALGETQTLVQQRIGLIGSDLSQAQLEQTNLRTLIDTIADYKKNNKNLLEIPAITAYGNVAALKNTYDSLVSQRQSLSERYGDQHPTMRQNTIATDDARTRLEEAFTLATSEVQARYNIATLREQHLRTDYATAEKQAQDLDKINVDYKFLENDSTVKRSAYNAILSRLNETTIVSQLDNVNIKVMDKAWVPSAPSDTAPSQLILQAATLALILLFGLPILFGILDSRVKSTVDVESALDQTLLGGIKVMKKLTETERPNVFRLAKDDALCEAYRGVFSEIEIRSTTPYPKRILITSSLPGEGKSLTASNLAAVFAAHGRRTLLVDCDFRRPSLRRYFGAPPHTGLLPWLHASGAADTESTRNPAYQTPAAAHQTLNTKFQTPRSPSAPAGLGVTNIAHNLDLLPAGDAIKNPTEVIDELAAHDIFNRLSRDYEVILIDTPPAAVFPDALLLSRFCSEMIYVCRFKGVRKALIKKTLTKFAETDITPLGIVLNCMPHSTAKNYGYNGYGSYNSAYYKSYHGEKAAT